MSMMIPLTQEECHKSLYDFFSLVASKAGYIESDVTMYNCTKIIVTPKVQEEIRSYYKEEGVSDTQIAAMFTIYGAKASFRPHNKEPYAAKIEDGFVTKSGEET